MFTNNRAGLIDKLRLASAIMVCIDYQNRLVEPPVQAMVYRDRAMRMLSPEEGQALQEGLETALRLLSKAS